MGANSRPVLVHSGGSSDLGQTSGTSHYFPSQLPQFPKQRSTGLCQCAIIYDHIQREYITIVFQTQLGVTFASAVLFCPMVAAISGNTGLQTSAIVMSGLATGHLAALRFGQVFMREVRIAALVATSCGIMGAMVCAAFYHFGASAGSTPLFALVFPLGMAMFSAIMVSTTLGLALPFLFRSIGIDPAISSGPIVTTANDSISVTIYLTLALLLAR